MTSPVIRIKTHSTSDSHLTPQLDLDHPPIHNEWCVPDPFPDFGLRRMILVVDQRHKNITYEKILRTPWWQKLCCCLCLRAPIIPPLEFDARVIQVYKQKLIHDYDFEALQIASSVAGVDLETMETDKRHLLVRDVKALDKTIEQWSRNKKRLFTALHQLKYYLIQERVKVGESPRELAVPLLGATKILVQAGDSTGVDFDDERLQKSIVSLKHHMSAKVANTNQIAARVRERIQLMRGAKEQTVIVSVRKIVEIVAVELKKLCITVEFPEEFLLGMVPHEEGKREKLIASLFQPLTIKHQAIFFGAMLRKFQFDQKSTKENQ